MKNKVIIGILPPSSKHVLCVCVCVCVCVKCASEPSSLFTSRIWPLLSTHITSPQKTTEIKVKQMDLRWRNDNTKNQTLWGNALQLSPSLFKVNRSLFHPTPARGFCWEMGGDYGVRWIKGLGSKVRSSLLASTGRHSPLGCQEEEDWSLGRRLPSRPDPVLSERRSGSLMDAPSWASGCESAATGLREGKGEDEHGFSFSTIHRM